MKRLAIAILVVACEHPATPITPGERIGAISLGMTWADVHAELGEPPSDPAILVGLGYAKWPARDLEVLFTSPDDSRLADAAIVVGVATTAPPSEHELVTRFGDPDEAYGGHAYYRSGMGLEYGSDGALARVAVFAASDAPRRWIERPAAAAGVDVDGRTLSVVDMHLHPGDYAAMAATGKAFVAGNLPPFLQVYAPELIDRISDPWAPHVGIADQASLAGVGHVVLFAVYAPYSTGTFTNAALLDILDDPRNIAPDGTPWAWGMASIDLSDWNEEVGATRLAELRSLLATHHELVGIKLAFAHQHVSLDDATTRGIYAIAQDAGVPILHHTGFSPFPGTETDPHYYDPLYLKAMLDAYPGVQVVLAHVGQGDARSVEHALDLAASNDRVWLELSALARPLLVDDHGAPVMGGDVQYPSILAAIRARGLVDRTLFASDGPQYPGAIRSYLGKLVDGMRAAGYTADEIEGVLSKNFQRLFTRAR